MYQPISPQYRPGSAGYLSNPSYMGGPTLPMTQPQPQMAQLGNLPQMAQAQPIQQIQNGIFGKVVSSINDIVMGDIPQDGSIGLFPQSDYSCIFAKQWNSDGSINTVKFVPEVPTPKEEDQIPAVTLADMMDQISDIKDIVTQLKNNKPYHQNKQYKYDKNRNAKVTEEVNDNA